MMHKLTRILVVAAVLLVPLAHGISAGAQGWGQRGPQYYGHMWNGGWHGWFFGPIMMIVFIAVTVVVVVLLVRWLGSVGHGSTSHSPVGKTPHDILEERFARGEIDKQEFEERRRVLRD